MYSKEKRHTVLFIFIRFPVFYSQASEQLLNRVYQVVNGVLANSKIFLRPCYLHYHVKMEVFVITPWNFDRKWYLRVFRYKHVWTETSLKWYCYHWESVYLISYISTYISIRSYTCFYYLSGPPLQFTLMSRLKISLIAFSAELFFTEYESFLKQE